MWDRRGHRLGHTLARVDPPPDVFAVVMATGVVSLAAADHHYRWISDVLGALAAGTFTVLGVGFLARALTQPRRVTRLTRDPDVALRMFTFVAACTVLAARWSTEQPPLEWGLAGLGLAGWLVLTPLAVADVYVRPGAVAPRIPASVPEWLTSSGKERVVLMVSSSAGTAQSSGSGRCRRCGQPVVGCCTQSGGEVAVDPRPVPGGELVINAHQNIIVVVRNPREAASARGRGESGFVPHDRVCPARGAWGG